MLIDTPGFNDTSMTEADVFTDIIEWLEDSHNGTKLNGIIYIHPIKNERIRGSPRHNLFMFRELCGTNALSKIILVTSFWDQVEEELGKRRETELKETPEYWGMMMKKGSRIARFQGRDSALSTVLELASQTTLSTQHSNPIIETMDPRLQADLVKLEAHYRKERENLYHEYQESLKTNDHELQEILKKELMSIEEKLKSTLREKDKTKSIPPQGRSVSKIQAIKFLEEFSQRQTQNETTPILHERIDPSNQRQSRDDTQNTIEQELPLGDTLPSFGITQPYQSDFNSNPNQYMAMIKSLSPYMPHLRNVGRLLAFRHQISGKLFCYKMRNNNSIPKLEVTLAYYTLIDPIIAVSKLHHLRFGQNQHQRNRPRRRFIIVEDLSPSIITSIGCTFWINPEFFEEHLNRSGHNGISSYSDNLPNNWMTYGTPKDFISFKWFRPIYRYHIKPQTQQDREQLLNSGSHTWTISVGKHLQLHTFELPNNIFRQEWPLVSNPELYSMDDFDEKNWKSNPFPAAWEERITIYYTSSQEDIPTAIILTDPLPEFKWTSTGDFIRQSEIHECLFKQAFSRAPLGFGLGLNEFFDGTPLSNQEIQRIGPHLNDTRSTRDDLTFWLNAAKEIGSQRMNMMTGLLWIIYRDITGFIHFVSKLLQDITTMSRDDYLIEQRLTYWRGILARLQTEIPEISKSLRELCTFISRFEDMSYANTFIISTINNLEKMSLETEKATTILRADLGSLENKRSIAQAESIGKLTELGFIFIPISCVATLFSMQVNELSNKVPLSSFVSGAIIAVGLAYGARIVLRSSAIRSFERSQARKIRIHANIPAGMPIPTRSFFSYLGSLIASVLPFKISTRAFKYRVLPLLCVVVLTTPILLIWQHKHLDIGFKAMMTVIVVILVATVTVPFMDIHWQSVASRVTNLHLGTKKRKSYRRSSTSTGTDSTTSGTSRTSRTSRTPRTSRISTTIDITDELESLNAPRTWLSKSRSWIRFKTLKFGWKSNTTDPENVDTDMSSLASQD